MKMKPVLAAVGLLLLAAGVAFAGDRLNRVGSGRNDVRSPDRNQAIFAATEIIRYPDRDNSIGRFDARTGAIYRFRGDVSNPSVRNSWELRVPAVSESHSGRLEIQQIDAARPNRATPVAGPRATFLVDVISGDTWILRLRDNENGSWDPISIFR